jgi:hypothetical protein
VTINGITDGLIKAIGLITKGKRPSKPRYEFERIGSVVHAKTYMSPKERENLNALLTKVQEAETQDEINERMMAVNASHRIKLVPLKRRTIIERSRYTGEKLREIRAKGGSESITGEVARRFARMNGLAFPFQTLLPAE